MCQAAVVTQIDNLIQKFRGPMRSPMLGIGILGLLVRLLFLWDSRVDPSFHHPLVDAKTYHDLASQFLTTGWTEEYLWQSVFYPAFLTLVYKVFGVSVLAVKFMHAVIGGASCALTYRLGSMVHDRRVGLGAGLILVFCGPVLFFESRLLATAWAVFWTVALTLFMVRCISRPSIPLLFAMGMTLALAVYTRPTFIPVGLAMIVFLLIPNGPLQQSLRRRVVNVGVVVAGFAVIVGPTSVFFQTTTGHLGLVPPSGGINLFIGNNPDYESTINIRPGLAWASLVAEPTRHGYEPNPWSGNQYFRSQTYRFVRSEPGRFLAGLGDKALTLVSSREIPRNLDVFLHREWSHLLVLSTWKIGAWGFPFGLIFPFVVVGFVRSAGRRALVIKVLLGVLAASLILVFVSARYCASLMPLFAVLAANGFVVALAALRRRNWRELLGVGGLLVGGILVCTVPGPFAQESVDLAAELYLGVGENLYDQQEWQQAVVYLDRSIALDPEVHASRQIIGICLANLKQFDLAILHFEEAVRLRPGAPVTEANLKQCRQERASYRFLAGREIELSDPFRAIGEYQVALRDVPTWYKPVARQAFVLATTAVDSVRSGERAVSLARRAVELRRVPDPYLQFVLAAALAESGRFDAAVSAANEALRLIADGKDDNMAGEIQQAIISFNARRPLRR